MHQALKLLLDIQELDIKMIRLMRVKKQRQGELKQIEDLRVELEEQLKLKQEEIADLEAKVADAKRFAAFAESRLNQWRSKVFF